MSARHGVYATQKATSVATPVVAPSGIPFVIGAAPAFSAKSPSGAGEPVLLVHEAARWLRADELDSVAWLPADQSIIPLVKEKLIDQIAAEVLQRHRTAFEELAK